MLQLFSGTMCSQANCYHVSMVCYVGTNAARLVSLIGVAWGWASRIPVISLCALTYSYCASMCCTCIQLLYRVELCCVLVLAV